MSTESIPLPAPVCRLCKHPGELVDYQDPYKGDVRLHAECLARIEARREADRLAIEAQARQKRAALLRRTFEGWNDSPGRLPTPDNMPRWPWARLENEEFRKRAHARVLTAYERYDHSEMGSLIMSAPTGRGKTAGALAWLHRLLDRTIERVTAGEENVRLPRPCWASGPELVRARKQHPLGEGEATLVQLAMDAGVLVLDELGFEQPSEVIFDVVDHRHKMGKPTIVTTGRTVAEFKERYGDALFRRLTEPGAVVEIK